jgi:RNA polymerase sigma-70 factor (ECF subfamily)
MVPESDIQNLVAQAQQGNSEAFGTVYDIYSKRLYNFLMGKVRHPQICEDLVHTVFLKAWTNLKNYHPRSNAKFSTWLFQIANYTLIDYWRTKKPTIELGELENLAQFAENPELYEDYAYLWQALNLLPLSYQIILDLRFRQDLSVAEASQIMGKSQIAIRVLQHRALKALKTKLKNYEL